MAAQDKSALWQLLLAPFAAKAIRDSVGRTVKIAEEQNIAPASVGLEFMVQGFVLITGADEAAARETMITQMGERLTELRTMMAQRPTGTTTRVRGAR